MSAIRKSTRFQSLDHWRGAACLFVIVYHATLVHVLSMPRQLGDGVAGLLLEVTHRLNLGVPLFFVISGYCISAAADNARRRQHSVRWYFVRRFRRIYPPLWILILCTAAAYFVLDYPWQHPVLSRQPWAQLGPWSYSVSQWIGNLTLTESWRHYVFGSGRAHFPGQAWTLCYEEQFYLVTGLLLAMSARRFFTGAAVVTVGTGLVLVASRVGGVTVEGFFFDGSWFLFAAGMLVYYQINYATRGQARVAQVALLLAIPLSGAYSTSAMSGSKAAFAVAAALPILYRRDRDIASSRLLKPLEYCGQMCYSLYLVHVLPVKAISTALYAAGVVSPWATLLVTVPTCVVASVAIGWIFHIAVERRFLNTSSSKLDVSSVPTNAEPRVASLAGV
jgi:peptidoglycan/LPS O-acetylase OafA/YrhL